MTGFVAKFLPSLGCLFALFAGMLFGIGPIAVGAAGAAGAAGAEPRAPEPDEPYVAPASPEAERAMAGFRLPEGWQVELVAAEPLMANPVAFFIDPRGRIFVCETFRQDRGVTDNRAHGRDWLHADLAAQTVEDRAAYHRRLLGDAVAEYTRYEDRLRLLEDTTGDGRIDRSTVFAGGFNALVDGTGAGVLVRGSDVYYACIPYLWRLRDTTGDGQADHRQPLHGGYGVRVAYRGHDLHGLVIGPDGKLYFSLGDRGYNVQTESGHFQDPESGAVFRCNLDGSELEVIATGLRNPQELAFDDFGNLFTVDNNSDSGDESRVTYIVEGGDSGWRMSYQYLSDRGPFNREGIWHLHHPEQPAHIVPPVAHLSDGPSGLTYYPGTGLGDQYLGRFFVCDFRGSPATSGVRSFRVEPRGAFFEMVDDDQPIWNILATDVDFGPDGALYVSDWVEGWTGVGKGRLYRFYSPEARQSELVRQVQQLLAAGFEDRSDDELAALVEHPDRRVRLESQFALAKRGAAERLIELAEQAPQQLARLHGIWGLGQVARQPSHRAAIAESLAGLFSDEDGEVRAQAAKVAGDERLEECFAQLLGLLEDASDRVRFFAAQSLAKFGRAEAVEPLVAALADNQDADPVLRHAIVLGLTASADSPSLADYAGHPSAPVRRGALLALRRQASPEVAGFLQDPDPLLVVEAARAIHDVPIPEALAALAELLPAAGDSEPLLRRALNANFRLGDDQHAERVAALAARASAPPSMRLEALQMLARWHDPEPLDRVLGKWRPLPVRDEAIARRAMRASLAGIFSSPADIRAAAAQVAAQLGIDEVRPVLRQLLDDGEQPARVRADALAALARLEAPELPGLLEAALANPAPQVRATARRLLAERQPRQAVPLLEAALADGEQVERQQAAAVLAQLELAPADEALARALDRLLDGRVPADTRLDVLMAAAARPSPALAQRLDQYYGALPPDDRVAPYEAALEGGDAERGREIFYERTAVSCVRCHKVDGQGGDVGPDLSQIGAEKDRRYLLESLVDPNRRIAQGFETVVLIDVDGHVHQGIVQEEDEHLIRLITADGQVVHVLQEQVDERFVGQSAMPEDLSELLSKFDVRDLVEYLSTLR